VRHRLPVEDHANKVDSTDRGWFKSRSGSFLAIWDAHWDCVEVEAVRGPPQRDVELALPSGVLGGSSVVFAGQKVQANG
jgi:hypothetical protein